MDHKEATAFTHAASHDLDSVMDRPWAHSLEAISATDSRMTTDAVDMQQSTVHSAVASSAEPVQAS